MKRRQKIINQKYNLTGRVFSELTVLELNAEFGKDNKSEQRHWRCLCSCGKEAVVASGALKSGHTRSCGHLNHSRAKKKFGLFREKVRKAWNHAIERCYDDSYKNAANYKGRGITVSDEFRSSFEDFYRYIGDPPTEKHTLERIDVNGNYERGNIKWETMAKQARNKTKPCTNTSGFTGVRFNITKGCTRAIAEWRVWSEEKGKFIAKNKSFSTAKYGLLPAFAMACAHREQMIAELNAQGYGYTENHGK